MIWTFSYSISSLQWILLGLALFYSGIWPSCSSFSVTNYHNPPFGIFQHTCFEPFCGPHFLHNLFGIFQACIHGVRKTLNLPRILTFLSWYSMSWPWSRKSGHGPWTIGPWSRKSRHGPCSSLVWTLSGYSLNDNSVEKMSQFILVFDINYWQYDPFFSF